MIDVGLVCVFDYWQVVDVGIDQYVDVFCVGFGYFQFVVFDGLDVGGDVVMDECIYVLGFFCWDVFFGVEVFYFVCEMVGEV